MPAWELPWPKVTTNHLWVRASRGQLRLSEAAVLWRDEVIVIVRQSGFRVPAGPLQVSLWLTPPDRRHRDADNLVKLTLDSVAAGLGIDDNCFRELHIYLMGLEGHRGDGGLLVRVRAAGARDSLDAWREADVGLAQAE